jgi:N utilization substance protein B
VDAGPRRGGRPNPRRRSREFALQGLYQWLLTGEDAGVIDALMREDEDFRRCDARHFDLLLHGAIREAAAIDEVIARWSDRRTVELSPVEHGALMVGVYELMHCLDIPVRVVISEGVELAKVFGGTDGHRFVNGVLDKAARQLRAAEMEARSS